MKLALSLFLSILFLTTCTERSSHEQSINHISNTVRYMNFSVTDISQKFIEENHVNSQCSDSLIVQISKLIDFIATTQDNLIEYSGGINENGEFISAADYSYSAWFLKEFGVLNEFRRSFQQMSALASDEEGTFRTLALNKVERDLRLFEFPVYDDSNWGQLNVTNFFNDLGMARTNLILTEMMYFEMLKSHTGC